MPQMLYHDVASGPMALLRMKMRPTTVSMPNCTLSQQFDQRYSPGAQMSRHEVDYEGDDLTLECYLETLRRPNGMTD